MPFREFLNNHRLHRRLALGAILIVALGFRLYDINRSPWIDELLTYDTASQGFKAALTTKFYPLTYILVNACLRIEDSYFLLRLPSLLAGLAGIWIIYSAGRAAYNTLAGLLGALLLTLASAHIVYSQEARFYAFLAAESIACIWMLGQALNTRRTVYWIGFAIAVICGTLTQGLFYLFLWGVVATAIAWLIVPVPAGSAANPKPRLRALVLSLFLALLPAIAAYYAHRSATLGTQVIIGADAPDSESFRLTPTEYLTFLYHFISCFPPLVNKVLICAAVWGLVVLWRQRRGWAVICLGAIFLNPLPLFFITLKHWYSAKYFIGQLPLFLLLASVGLAELANRVSLRYRRYFVPAFIAGMLALIFTSSEFYFYRTYEGRMHYKIREWQKLAPPIIERSTANDLIVHLTRYRRTAGLGKKGTPIEWYELQRYLERQTPHGRIPLHPTRYLGTTTTEELRQVIAANPDRTLWVVVDRQAWYEFDQGLANVLTTESASLRHRVYSIGEPTVNLVQQPQVPAGSNDSSPYRITCAGGTSVSLAIRSRDSETTSTVLNPTQRYTLSAYIKYKDIRPDPEKTTAGEPVMNEDTAGFVALSGVRANGESFHRKLMLFDGQSDWRQIAIPVNAGDIQELADARQLTVDIGVGDKKASLRADKVQLEPKDHVTPFTPDERHPHDQALARLDDKLTTAAVTQ